MVEKLKWIPFGNIDINEPFFDSLKADYPGFENWYESKKEKNALTFFDETGLHAFMYLKREDEEIALTDKVLPNLPRVKIGTLKLDDTIKRKRLGEGFIGVALWNWQKLRREEIYVTVFPKQKTLISLFEKFGFRNVGSKSNGEYVLLRSRKAVDYSTPYTSFPFINPQIAKGGIIPINDSFHDRLFPYSDTSYRLREIEESTAGNGVTKVYIGTPYMATHYRVGDLVGIYRIYTGPGPKGNKSAVTSFCTITKTKVVKENGNAIFSLQEYLAEAGNKTVFSENELKAIYNGSKNVVMIELLYNGFFEKGNNVTYWQLKNKGLFESHPYNIDYTLDEIKDILKLGKIDVENIIID
jgi:hypothetical protein